jgi:hypothetical protein
MPAIRQFAYTMSVAYGGAKHKAVFLAEFPPQIQREGRIRNFNELAVRKWSRAHRMSSRSFDICLHRIAYTLLSERGEGDRQTGGANRERENRGGEPEVDGEPLLL